MLLLMAGFSVAQGADDKSATVGRIRWDIKSIKVCWIAPDPDHAALRDLVRASVEATWVKQSGLQLTGWGTCQADEKAVRIAVRHDLWPRAHIGKMAYETLPSMFLNFELDKMRGWERCRGRLEQCIRATSVHEFGHMLGLIHEQDRPDVSDKCRLSLSADQINLNIHNATDLQLLTLYDDQSVMNYCNAARWSAPVEQLLSAGDIKGIRTLFGEPDMPAYSRPAGGLQHLHILAR